MTHILDCEVHGEGSDWLLFLHGWPDSRELWANQLAHFSKHYRCLAITLPNYGPEDPVVSRFGYSFEELVTFIHNTLMDAGFERGRHTLTLVQHDWGSAIGFLFQSTYPDLVNRMVALDVASDVKPGFLAILGILTYQSILVTAWLLWQFLPFIGAYIGTYMTYIVARFFGAPRTRHHPISAFQASMNYPYVRYYLNGMSPMSSQTRKRIAEERKQQQRDGAKKQGLVPPIPVMYIFGKHKPFMFHTERFLKALEERKDCRWIGYECGHWVSNYPSFNQDVENFLNENPIMKRSS